MKFIRVVLGLATILLPLAFSATVSATSYPIRPSAQIVQDQSDGKYYYIYNFPGTNYTQRYKKYIGSADVLAYYINALGIARVPEASSADLATYTTYNWTLNFPCGIVIGSRNNVNLYSTEGYGGTTWYLRPDLDPSSPQSAGFSDSGMSDYIQSLDSQVLKDYASHVLWTNNIPNSSLGSEPLYNGLSTTTPLPCTIVHQTGTSDYYRIIDKDISWGPGGPSVSPPTWQKEPIGNTELLNIWLKYNNYVQVTTDISSMATYDAAATLPAGMLVRTIDSPQVYVTDDEGVKIPIQSIETFYGLGYNLGSVQYVSQETLDSTPTVNYDL